jgi:hypothetical protein
LRSGNASKSTGRLGRKWLPQPTCVSNEGGACRAFRRGGRAAALFRATRHPDRAGRRDAQGHGCMMHCCSRPLPGLPERGKNAKIRAGSELIRRISAMFIFSIRTVVLAVAVSASSLSSAAALSEQSELLCSPEGLMRLIPQFNTNGKFTIPDPNTDLQTFLSAHQGLSNAIDMILAQENIRAPRTMFDFDA